MATTFKTFLNNDIVSSRTLLHESIPLTGSVLSGTYNGASGAEHNLKTYSHAMFTSLYDYPYLSSSANHVIDITCGFSSDSSLSRSAASTGATLGFNTEDQQKKKINIYNQMAQMLMGYDATGSIQKFDEDGDLLAGGTKIREAIFLNLSRLLVKDEIKKGSFTLVLGVDEDYHTPMNKRIKVVDSDGTTSFKTNSPAGEYGILYADTHGGGNGSTDFLGTDDGTQKAGLIFYQAGIVVLTASVFNTADIGGLLHNTNAGNTPMDVSNGTDIVGGSGKVMTVTSSLSGGTIQNFSNGVRHKIFDLSFNNTTELNSTIHFCRANHNEFNYSTNPTYLSNSKIVVKDSTLDSPVSYISTIGLYSADNELLAVAKLSEPIKKDPTTELTFRVRLDY